MTLAQQIAEAEAALHKLQTGRLPVEFQDQNGERIRFSLTQAPRLIGYIADLKRQLSGLTRPHTITFKTSKGLQ